MIPLDKYPNIYEKCSNFPDNHPLIIASTIEIKGLLNLFESLLSKLREVKGLSSKINEIKKDKGNFNSYVSELKVAAFLKDRVDDLEIIPSSKGGKNSDIRANKGDKEFFVEVKLLADLESKLFEEIHRIESSYIVEVEAKDLLTESEIESLIEIIKQKIERGEKGEFLENFANIRIRNKSDYGIKYKEDQRTYLLKTQKESIKINFKKVKRKILLDFYDKIGQLTNKKPTIWAIDLARWYVDEKDIEEIVYGRDYEDRSIFWKVTLLSDLLKSLCAPYFEKIEKAYKRDRVIMNNYNLLPSLYFRKLDGLFMREESEYLNGILLLQKNNDFVYYPNPFVKDDLYVPNMERFFE